MFITIVTFLLVTGIVAFISWKKTKNDDLSTSKGYFLAGRGLSGLVIGCSMVLTSLSTEQLIGVNAVSYKGNFSIYYCLDSTICYSIVFLSTLFIA